MKVWDTIKATLKGGFSSGLRQSAAHPLPRLKADADPTELGLGFEGFEGFRVWELSLGLYRAFGGLGFRVRVLS